MTPTPIPPQAMLEWLDRFIPNGDSDRNVLIPDTDMAMAIRDFIRLHAKE